MAGAADQEELHACSMIESAWSAARCMHDRAPCRPWHALPTLLHPLLFSNQQTGHVVLEGRPTTSTATTTTSRSITAPRTPLYHCVWMAMELLGLDLWESREQGAAFVGPSGAAQVAAAGKGALQVHSF